MLESVVVRCDASPEIGLGHLTRSLALATEARDTYHATVVFAMRGSPIGARIAREAGFPVVALPILEPPTDTTSICSVLRETRAQVVILDVRDELDRAGVESIADNTRVVVAAIDDFTGRRLAADLVFFAPEPQSMRLDWSGARGRAYIGWEWIALRREFSDTARRVDSGEVPRVLIAMGGSDPDGLTSAYVRSLGLVREPLRASVVVGPAFAHRPALQDALEAAQVDITIEESPGSMSRLMQQSDLAITSFGVTSYEAAACGLPQITVGLTPDHVEAAVALVDAGAAISLGLAREIRPQDLSSAVGSLLRAPKTREGMGRRARECVDGRGAERIVRVIAGGLADREGLGRDGRDHLPGTERPQ